MLSPHQDCAGEGTGAGGPADAEEQQQQEEEEEVRSSAQRDAPEEVSRADLLDFFNLWRQNLLFCC